MDKDGFISNGNYEIKKKNCIELKFIFLFI